MHVMHTARGLTRRWWMLLGIAVLGWPAPSSLAAEGGGELPPLWGLGVLPFVALLGAIAILPLLRFSHHWWENNLHRLYVALGAALATVGYYSFIAGVGVAGIARVLDHALLQEYVPFMVLLFCLYVIAGGIALRGNLPAHPATNTAFLGVGALLASFIGTTGASMLLIRPLLQTNKERKEKVHTVVFFIFLVSNIGGTLLPIGDPPLFLGYLAGVPFFWTLSLWREWLVCSGLLLAVYYVWDTLAWRTEKPRDRLRDEAVREPLRLEGRINVLWLLGVVAAVAFVVPGKPFPLLGFTAFPFLRELLMLGFVALSLKTTAKEVRAHNHFNYAAIIEVAVLFFGIFIAMQMPIAVLNARGAELGLAKPWHFFWATGSLSSVLDNAPTYMVFFKTAESLTHAAGPGALALVDGGHVLEELLVAVSLGAVFMGAMTYIGNGPNFMVKAIAEQSGVEMPSFFGYVFRYSLPILGTLFIVITFLFLLGPAPGTSP